MKNNWDHVYILSVLVAAALLVRWGCFDWVHYFF